MGKTTVNVSDNEFQILETLWRENRALSRTEIINLTENKTWKESSIHVLLNQLLDKGLLKVDGFEKTGKNYGRKYAPTLSKNSFDFNKLKSSFLKIKPKKTAISDFLNFLVETDNFTTEDLDMLKKSLEDKDK